VASEQTRHKHFSMIRTFQLADLFTIANGFCGMLAIFEAMTFLSTRATRHLYLAAVLIPVALIFDVLDGRIARGRHAASALGRELDSLADVVSFGVALARYNITAERLSAQTGRVEYFEGTPIPTSIVPLGVLMLAFHRGSLYRVNLLGIEWHATVLLFLVSGSLMISKTLRIPKP